MNNILSPWGVVLVAVLLAVVMGLLWVVDHRMLRLLWRVNFSLKPRLLNKKMATLATVVALLVGVALATGCLMACLRGCRLWPVAGVVLVLMLLSVPRGMQAYQRSLLATEAHRRYLLACGASHLEEVMPSVRRALRAALLPLTLHRMSPMVWVLPLLLFALLMGGFPLWTTVGLVLLVWGAVLASSVLATVLAIWLADRWQAVHATRSSKRL